jgi:hypothetical protein
MTVRERAGESEMAVRERDAGERPRRAVERPREIAGDAETGETARRREIPPGIYNGEIERDSERP